MEQQGGLSDAELVRRALGARTPGERKAAFGGIADRYRLTVFRQCARWYPHPEEAQDICQIAVEDAFTLRAAGKAPDRPDKLAGWLIEIARRRGLNRWGSHRPGDGQDARNCDRCARQASPLHPGVGSIAITP
jgi:DNA-directed RNA polymerase specialized sigma24 family protein